MTLATLSALVYDPLGHVLVNTEASTKLGDAKRRVNRVATMDGSAAVNDGGYSESDRTIELHWQTGSQAYESTIERLLQLYAQVLVCTRLGAYVAAPETYSAGTDESFVRLLALSKVSD
jgi:hypothetical protein